MNRALPPQTPSAWSAGTTPRALRRCAALFFAVTSLCPGALAQGRAQFDFGTGAVANNHEQIDGLNQSGTVDSGNGIWTWSWASTGQTMIDRGPVRDPDSENNPHGLTLTGSAPEALVRDSVTSASQLEFNVQVAPNATYLVSFQLGDIGDIGETTSTPTKTPKQRLAVNIGGLDVGSLERREVFAHSLTKKASIATGKLRGGTRHVRMLVTASAAGLLRIRVRSAKPSQQVSWQGLDIVEVGATHRAPLLFDQATGTLQMVPANTSPAMQSSLSDFALTLNYASGHVALAALLSAESLAVTDEEKLDAAWARAWLIGWLGNWADVDNTGYADASWKAKEPQLLLDLQANLTDIETNPAIENRADFVSLKRDTEAFAMAALFAAARGYTVDTFPVDPAFENRYKIKNNVFCAVSLLEQIDSDALNAESLASDLSSAFGPKGYYKIAWLHHTMNTQAKAGDVGEFQSTLDYWMPMMLKVHDLLDPIDESGAVPVVLNPIFDCPDAFVNASLIKTLSELGRDPEFPADLVHVGVRASLEALHDPAAASYTWWGEGTEPNSGAAPTWANSLFYVTNTRRLAAEWWSEVMLLENEAAGLYQLGGGGPDDVEIVRSLLGLMGLLREGGGNQVEQDGFDLLRALLNLNSVHPTDFYWANPGDLCDTSDIEHGIEQTYDTYAASWLFDFGAPSEIEPAFATVRNLDEIEADCNGDPGSWSSAYVVNAATGEEARHIRSWKLGAKSVTIVDVTGHPFGVDTTWTSRLLEPSRLLSRNMNSEGARRRLREFALGWYLAAGVAAPEIVNAQGDIVAHAKPAGVIPWAVDAGGIATSVYDLGNGIGNSFLMPRTGHDDKFARPNGQSIRDWYKNFSELHRSDTGPVPGGPESWLDPLLATASWLLAHPTEIAAKVSPYLMYKDAIVPVVFAERNSFTDPNDVALMNQFLVEHGTDYQKFLMGLGSQTDLDQVAQDSSVEIVGDTLRLAFPFVSSFAMWTDKVALFSSGTTDITSGTGAVSWFDPEAFEPVDSDLDVAVFVTMYDREASILEAVIYNYGDTRDIGIKLGADFQEGTYRVKYAQTDEASGWGLGASSFGDSLEFKGPGEEFVLTDSSIPGGILGGGQATKVRIARVGKLFLNGAPHTLPTERMDLAANVFDFSSNFGTVTIHNLGRADYDAANGTAELVFEYVTPSSSSPPPFTVPLTMDLPKVDDSLMPQSMVVTLPALAVGDWKMTIVASDTQDDWTRANNTVRFEVK